jgi:hypothetical protein
MKVADTPGEKSKAAASRCQVRKFHEINML